MRIQSTKNILIPKKCTRFNSSKLIAYYCKYTYCLDSGPLRLDMVRLKESVFDDPGAPTMISGVLVTVQIIVANKFSFSASVLAMPVGRLSSLV